MKTFRFQLWKSGNLNWLWGILEWLDLPVEFAESEKTENHHKWWTAHLYPLWDHHPEKWCEGVYRNLRSLWRWDHGRTHRRGDLHDRIHIFFPLSGRTSQKPVCKEDLSVQAGLSIQPREGNTSYHWPHWPSRIHLNRHRAPSTLGHKSIQRTL